MLWQEKINQESQSKSTYVQNNVTYNNFGGKLHILLPTRWLNIKGWFVAGGINTYGKEERQHLHIKH